jgi:drug/metabolite transporter (DMT)-like permease
MSPPPAEAAEAAAAASSDRPRDALDPAAMALLVVLCATWGLQQVAVKVANAGISPLTQVGWRSAGAALLLMAWARARGVPLFARDWTLGPGLAAGALFAAEFALIYWGLALTDAARGVLFIYTAPFFVALGAHWFVPGDRLTRLKAIGLAAAFAGLAIAFADGLSLPTGRELAGDLLCLAGAALWGATTVLIKASRLARVSAEKTLFWQLGVAALALPALALALGEPGFFAPTPLVLAAFAFQAVVVAFASFTAWFWLVRRYPASRLASFTFLTPVFGVAFGGLLLGERVGPALIASVALISVGVWLVNRPGR